MNGKHTNDKLNQALGMLDDKFISEAENYTSKHLSHIQRAKKWYLTAAACIVLIVLSVGIYGCAEEIKEYNEAASFFEENNLPLEGLSRNDIKEVYRDITAGSFSYDKTADVITSSITVSGYEILQNDPTPEDIEEFWNFIFDRNNSSTVNSKPAYSKYMIRYVENSETTENYEWIFKGYTSFLEKYDDNQPDVPVWSIEFKNIKIFDYADCGKSIYVYGEHYNEEAPSAVYGDAYWIALVNENGNILWEKILDIENESYASLYFNNGLIFSESSVIIFSRGTDKSNKSIIYMREYDTYGKLIFENEIDMKDIHSDFSEYYRIENTVKFEDGYILHFNSTAYGDNVIKLNKAGELTDTFTYESDDCVYHIQDIIEYNGRIYFSATVTPILQDNTLYNRNEDLTSYLQKFHTAVLLICDMDSGEPKEFYSVKSSMGSDLSISSDGKLIWEIKNITGAYSSLEWNSHSIEGLCHIYKYTFEQNGKITKKEKTGDTVTFYM